MGLMFDKARFLSSVGGYSSTSAGVEPAPETTTDNYAEDQQAVNTRKTLDFLLPILRRTGSHSALDVGCGVGVMVQALCANRIDAYGVDIDSVTRYWAAQALSRERFAVVGIQSLALPFADGALDFVYSFGVIEHIGTSDGHADRLPDYHEIRRQWLTELCRVVKTGGHLLIGGPNRNFPVDVAHGPDSRASRFENWLSRQFRATIHKPWGENFLWGYNDISRYLPGGAHWAVKPISIAAYVGFSRVPPLLRPLAEAYIRYLPGPLLGTGFNPWVMALIKKEAPHELV